MMKKMKIQIMLKIIKISQRIINLIIIKVLEKKSQK